MKLEWKRQVKTAISAYWRDTILEEATQKATLKYLNCDNYRPGKVHSLWTSAGLNFYSVHRAYVHVKLATDTYILQANLARFNQFAMSTMSPLCSDGTEDIRHFLLQCSHLESSRRRFMDELERICDPIFGSHITREQQEELLVRLVMDASMVQDMVGEAATDETQQLGRGLCSALHVKRSACLLLATSILDGSWCIAPDACIMLPVFPVYKHPVMVPGDCAGPGGRIGQTYPSA